MPIAIFCVSTTSIAVHPSVPAKNVKELVAYVKANPGKLSLRLGRHRHDEPSLRRTVQAARPDMTDVVHVPYKGAGPGIADLVSGHIPIMSPNITGQVLEFHKTGKIRILAVNAPERLKAAPDIPTAIEQGVPNMIGQLFLGIYAPAATPAAAVDAICRRPRRRRWRQPEFEKVADRIPASRPCPISGEFGAADTWPRSSTRWKPVVDAIGLKTN